MASMQPFFWYVSGFVQKYKIILIISVCSGIALFILLPSFIRFVPFGRPTRYIGRVGSFSLSKLPKDIQLLSSFGLTYVDEKGDVLPALASTFQAQDGGTSYRFTIRPNVLWQDGKEVQTKDIDYNFSNIDVVRNQSDIMYSLTGSGDNQSADAFLPSSFPVVVSQPLFRQVTTRSFLFWKKTSIYGLGTYRISSIVHKGLTITSLTLDSQTDSIVYRFYPTEEDAINAFKQGNVDSLEYMQNIGELDAWSNVEKNVTERFDQYLGVFFNTAYVNQEDRPYANKQLRVALNYAIQKQTGSSRILSPIQKNSWGYVGTAEDLDPFTQDLKTAVDTYLKAGIFSPITIELTTIPSFIKQAENIKQSWETLGKLSKDACIAQNLSPSCSSIDISVSLRITNSPDLSNYQVLLVGQQIPSDPDQYAIWHSTQPTNFTHFKNARIDKLLEDGRKATNKDERKLIYQEFARLLVKESPAIFLETIKTININRKPLW